MASRGRGVFSNLSWSQFELVPPIGPPLTLTSERLDDSGEEEVWHIPNWLYILLICCVVILMLRRVPEREAEKTIFHVPRIYIFLTAPLKVSTP